MTDAGVVDNGGALVNAVGHCSELSMKCLLQQRKGDEATYVNYRNPFGKVPRLFAIDYRLWRLSFSVSQGRAVAS